MNNMSHTIVLQSPSYIYLLVFFFFFYFCCHIIFRVIIFFFCLLHWLTSLVCLGIISLVFGFVLFVGVVIVLYATLCT
ncbi:hypothetical protein BGX38DRAFT_1176932 [Terfezia claveryi]|nr:hypothetical protein BGX38DRAFT_1176932 [Terfezia claveryi]